MSTARPVDVSAQRFVTPASTRTLVPTPRYDVGNKFVMELGGPETPRAVGSFQEQLRQATTLATLALKAEESLLTLGYYPSDFSVNATLRGLDPTPVIGGPRSVSIANYTSQIPQQSPTAVFSRMAERPVETFASAGLKIRGGATRLEDGARIMLQDANSFPPLWFPVEVNVDKSNGRITFHSLDGHPLRGTNEFRFVSDGAKGTKILQRSQFQSSSAVTAIGAKLSGGLDHQHAVWRNLHAGLFKALRPF